jgi:hypothetical protein
MRDHHGFDPFELIAIKTHFGKTCNRGLRENKSPPQEDCGGDFCKLINKIKSMV